MGGKFNVCNPILGHHKFHKKASVRDSTWDRSRLRLWPIAFSRPIFCSFSHTQPSNDSTLGAQVENACVYTYTKLYKCNCNCVCIRNSSRSLVSTAAPRITSGDGRKKIRKSKRDRESKIEDLKGKNLTKF